MSKYHTPVLLQESIDGLNIKPDGVYVDVTFGGGGHSREILSRLTTGTLIGFDQDTDAEANQIDDERFIFVKGNFAYLKNFLRYVGHAQVDGILADLGVSSHHFDEEKRGFSFRFDADLDMRMNQQSTLDAAQILNKYTGEQLSKLFATYGEIKNANFLSKNILAFRQQQPFVNTAQLRESIHKCVPKKHEHKYLAKVFQALRIEVNKEMDVLQQFLEQTPQVLCPNGRLSVITYHSLEDRLVKNYMKKGLFSGEPEKDLYGNFETPFSLINRKVIIPTDAEIKQNNRARSAKLRIAEKNA